MSDEAVVEETNQNPQEEPEVELNEEDLQDTEEPTAEGESEIKTLKEQLAKKQGEIDKLYARYKSEKEVREELEKKPATKSQPNDDSDWKAKIEFVTTTGRNLDADDVEELVAIAKGKGISYDEALNSPVMKAYLKVKQAKAKVANATPSTSSSSKKVNGKTWSTMDNKEREANFTRFRDQVAKRA